AEQLGQIPAFFPGDAARQGLLDGGEPARGISGDAETGRKLAERKQEARQQARLAGRTEPAAQSLEPADDIAAPRHHHALEATRPDVPQPYRGARGGLEQRLAIAFGGL